MNATPIRAELPARTRTLRKRMTRSIGIAAATTLLTVAFANSGPASAQSNFLVRYTNHEEGTLGDLVGDDCVPFPVVYTYDASGTFHGLTHGDSPYYGADHFNESFVFTNLDNGKTLSSVSLGVDKDVHVTDDGTGILTIEALETGPTTWYASDGKPLFRDAGMFTFTVVVDTNGTPLDPDDDMVLDWIFTGSHGVAQTQGRDFCADLTEFIR